MQDPYRWQPLSASPSGFASGAVVGVACALVGGACTLPGALVSGACAPGALVSGACTLIGGACTLCGAKEDDAPETKALLAVSSDKGLCGGINSRVVKEIKRIYDEEPAVEPKVRTTHTFMREGPPPPTLLITDARFSPSLLFRS